MDCPRCSTPMVTFEVPTAFRDHAPGDVPGAALCPACLTLEPAEETSTDPRFDRISDDFPTGDAAPLLAVAVGLLDSLALNRAAIEELLLAVEERGTDPLLVLDRLHAQGGVQPDFDLQRRRHQLEQLLE